MKNIFNLKSIIKSNLIIIKNILMNIKNRIKNKIKNRLNKDCFGKRLIIKIQNVINFKFTRDIIPLFTIIIAKFYLFIIIYISILDIISLY